MIKLTEEVNDKGYQYFDPVQNISIINTGDWLIFEAIDSDKPCPNVNIVSLSSIKMAVDIRRDNMTFGPV